MNDDINYCPNCGTKNLDKSSRFCGNCGFSFYSNKNYYRGQQYSKTIGEQAKDTFDGFVNKVNTMAGGSGQVELNLRDLVINVFQKHTIEERENIFICGTARTTPREEEISSEWPKPWLYSRVFMVFAVTFVILVSLLELFHNVNAYPGIIFIGALAVPFSLLVFFWEVNAPRNINIFDVTKIFFIGGVFSLLVTLMLDSMFSTGQLDYSSAILTGIIEEVGKIVVVAYFLRGTKEKYILNGLLLGAAVGAGFAVFETAGYGFRALIMANYSAMMSTIYLRGIFAFGSHIVWAAMSGAALVMAKKGNILKMDHIMSGQFLKFFIIAIMLHAIWDMPIDINSDIPFVQIMLTGIAWIIILVLISVGLKQISNKQKTFT
ncbi:PrsW family intramembrane metalloprotease [Clostridium sp. JS66]|uniref:PrsW family intramembrane metalloprotease n=1 Tax=Clostridium sp. JS66 TaxID=3064705 RepID=UPI00298E84CA|nr:PrsW family intramembrane metalloprotease [Clostridium sp. JS66]WPC44231.1 PrsW family intramembrane metalloprotease [Clostridium sp. JS66]